MCPGNTRGNCTLKTPHLILAGMLIIAPWVLRMALAQAEPVRAAGGWRTLVSHRAAPAWRGWKSDSLPNGWQVVGEELRKDGVVDDLVTREQFGNFELEVEWNIGREGNSGIFYRATRDYDHIYWSAPEYQL